MRTLALLVCFLLAGGAALSCAQPAHASDSASVRISLTVPERVHARALPAAASAANVVALCLATGATSGFEIRMLVDGWPGYRLSSIPPSAAAARPAMTDRAAPAAACPTADIVRYFADPATHPGHGTITLLVSPQ